MKKLMIAALLVALCSGKGYGQKKRVDVDKFTGDTSVTIEEQFLGYVKTEKGKKVYNTQLSVMTAKLAKAGTVLYFYFKPMSVLGISKGSSISIKLSDGEVISLANMKAFEAYSPSDMACVYTLVKDDVLNKLKDSSVTAIRIETSKYPVDYDLEADKQKIIGQALSSL